VFSPVLYFYGPLIVLMCFIIFVLLSYLKIPKVVIMIFFGFTLQFFLPVDFITYSGVIRKTCFCFLLIRVVLCTNFETLKKNYVKIICLGILPFIGEFFSIFVLLYNIYGYDWQVSLIICFVVTPIGPSIIITIILQLFEEYGYDTKYKELFNIILITVPIEIIIPLTGYGLISNYIKSTEKLALDIAWFPLSIIISILIGVFFFVLIFLAVKLNNYFNNKPVYIALKQKLMKNRKIEPHLVPVFFGVFVLIVYGFVDSFKSPFGLISTLTVLAMMYFLTYVFPTKMLSFNAYFKYLWYIGQMLLFMFIGIIINIKYFKSDVGRSFTIAVVGFFGRIISNIITMSVETIVDKVRGREMNYKKIFEWYVLYTILTIPKATIQSVLAAQPMTDNLFDTDTNYFITNTGVLTIVVQNVLFIIPFILIKHIFLDRLAVVRDETTEEQIQIQQQQEEQQIHLHQLQQLQQVPLDSNEQ